MSELDKKDARLATLLQADGRVANARLAEQLHLSEATCWRRHKRLEELGVIEGYQAILNRRKVGASVLAFVQITCTQHSEAATAEFERIIQASSRVPVTQYSVSAPASARSAPSALPRSGSSLLPPILTRAYWLPG